MKKSLSHARKTKSRKNLLFLCVLIALTCVTVLAACGKTDNTPVTTAPTPTPAANETQTPKLTSTPKPTNSPKPVESEAPSEVSTETLASIIEGVLANNFENCEITYTDDSITINVWQNGIALAVSSIHLAGGDENHTDWVTMKNSMITLAGSICDLIDTSGRTDVLMYMNVLNDQNTENTLLMLLDTTIVYDCLA